MSARSLRLRLVLGGIVAILLALSIAGVSLTVLFERHVTRTITGDLDVDLRQLIAGLDVGPAGRLVLTRAPTDPRFADPLSGLYWQVSAEDGQLLRSRSLWDTVLPPSGPAVPPGQVLRREGRGPGGAPILTAERQISLTIDGRRVPVRLAVATDLARIAAARAAFARDLAAALALLALVLAAATTVQVTLGLRPLEAVRREIAAIRSGRSRRLLPAAPLEVQPLVEEVNALLDSQEREMERSRSRAADLAHGLKTPLAALATDAARLRASGQDAVANNIEAVGQAMSRHIDRELARARVRGSARRGSGWSSELGPLVRSLIETLARTGAGRRLIFEPRIPEGMVVLFDRVDLAEVLGNLLDNAARHAAARVRITAFMQHGGVTISIEDDGEGIDPAALPKIVERGIRLDRRGDGAGLGLAIVQDMLDAYGWRLELDRSGLGGVRATITSAPTPGPEDSVEQNCDLPRALRAEHRAGRPANARPLTSSRHLPRARCGS